ncbi:MAG: dihydrofolate reductase family protein [Kofleriaceae bacterium]
MSKVRFNLSISLDGYLAGPNQDLENPLGVGGMRLHDWAFALAAFREGHGETGGEVNASTQIVEEMRANVGAVIMGRNMFGPIRGDWDPAKPWNGWWGPNPPYHVPVYVLTHHARAALPMEGGTTFHFVTDGIESALHQARAVAGDKDIVLGGGAALVRQFLAAGFVDQLDLVLVPITLGAGERLYDGVDLALEPVRVIEAPGVTHLRYRLKTSSQR